MKILITGASGFIGEHVIEALDLLGHEIYAASFKAVPKNFFSDNVKWITFDILDATQVSSVMSKFRPELLIHLAWSVEPERFWESPDNLLWAYYSLNLVKAFERSGGRKVVVAGSCAEYSWEHGLCDEGNTPTYPSTIYGACKDITRKLIFDFCIKNKLIINWGRVFFPYGPGESTQRLLPQIINSFIFRKELIISHPFHSRDFIHVMDVASAIVHLAVNTTKSDCYNICSGHSMQISNIVTECKKYFQELPIIHMGIELQHKAAPVIIGGSNEKIKSIGWIPGVNFSDGLKEYIRYLSSA